MWDNFTQELKKTIGLAEAEACAAGSQLVGPDHMFVAILKSDNLIVRRSIERLSIDASDVIANIRGSFKREQVEHQTDEPILSPDGMKALDFASEEARAQKCKFIGTEHLLFGLARVPDTAAATILAEKGITVAILRGAVEQGVANADGEAVWPPAPIFQQAIRHARRPSTAARDHIAVARGCIFIGLLFGTLFNLFMPAFQASARNPFNILFMVVPPIGSIASVLKAKRIDAKLGTAEICISIVLAVIGVITLIRYIL
jgi:hypothetical protein